MSGEAFTKAPAVDEFDLDAWIDGAKLPEKSVTVYGRADLVAEFYELEHQLRAAGGESGVQDDRLTGDPRVAMAQRIEELRGEMEKSARTFRFRALLETERVKREDRKNITDDELTYANLSIQAISPKVSEEQWPKIRERIGEGQFAALLEAAGSASYDRQVSVPFSLAASALLTSQDS